MGGDQKLPREFYIIVAVLCWIAIVVFWILNQLNPIMFLAAVCATFLAVKSFWTKQED
jgi:Flp pilus assembly protein TadB